MASEHRPTHDHSKSLPKGEPQNPTPFCFPAHKDPKPLSNPITPLASSKVIPTQMTSACASDAHLTGHHSLIYVVVHVDTNLCCKAVFDQAEASTSGVVGPAGAAGVTAAGSDGAGDDTKLLVISTSIAVLLFSLFSLSS